MSSPILDSKKIYKPEHSGGMGPWFIGKEGYFGNDLGQVYANMVRDHRSVLIDIFHVNGGYSTTPFISAEKDASPYKYFYLIDDKRTDTEETKEVKAETSEAEVYTYANKNDAQKYMGMQGYFANSYDDLLDVILAGTTKKLVGIERLHGEVLCFNSHNNETHETQLYGFFQPVKKVENTPEIQVTYKQYSLDEFLATFKLGESIIHMRCKQSEYSDDDSSYAWQEICGVFNGYSKRGARDTLSDEYLIHIGAYCYSGLELFSSWEIYDEKSGEWKPFGKKDV